jgi:hypothetical protein
MNRKLVAVIALAAIVLAGLFYGLNAALGSEPAPKGSKQETTRTVKADEDSTQGIVETARDIFDAVGKDEGDDGKADDSGSPADFLRNLPDDDE